MIENHFMTKRNKELMNEKKDLVSQLETTKTETQRLNQTVLNLSESNQEKHNTISQLKKEVEDAKSVNEME